MLLTDQYTIIPRETPRGAVPVVDINKNGYADPEEPVIEVSDQFQRKPDHWCGTPSHMKRGKSGDDTHFELSGSEVKERVRLRYDDGQVKSLQETFATNESYVCGGELLLCTALGIGSLTVHSGLLNGLESRIIR